MKIIERLPRSPYLRTAIAAAVILALWFVAATVYRWISAPRAAAEQKAEAIVQQETAEATAAVATEAATVTREVYREHVRIDEITRRNDHAIKSAAGAETRVPDVAAALNRSLCQRAAYHGEPDCAAVRGDGGSIGAAGTDAGSNPAAN